MIACVVHVGALLSVVVLSACVYLLPHMHNCRFHFVLC